MCNEMYVLLKQQEKVQESRLLDIKTRTFIKNPIRRSNQLAESSDGEDGISFTCKDWIRFGVNR